MHKLYVRRNKITAVALSERTLAVASESCTTSKKCEIEFWAVGPEIKLEENSENGVEFIENRENKEKQEEISRKWEKLKGSVVCHSLAVTDMAFSPDGQFLVSASRDKSVGVFGVAKGINYLFHYF